MLEERTGSWTARSRAVRLLKTACGPLWSAGGPLKERMAGKGERIGRSAHLQGLKVESAHAVRLAATPAVLNR